MNGNKQSTTARNGGARLNYYAWMVGNHLVSRLDSNLPWVTMEAPTSRCLHLSGGSSHEPRFLLALCQEISDRSIRSVDRLFMRSAYPVRNQAAFFILDNLYHNEFTIRKSEMSASLGVTYRHIERIMNDFVEEGILKKEKRTYSVLNKSVLEELAQDMVSHM